MTGNTQIRDPIFVLKPVPHTYTLSHKAKTHNNTKSNGAVKQNKILNPNDILVQTSTIIKIFLSND